MIVALDTEGGKILVRGWQDKLRLRPDEVIPQLEKYASGFLCTYVDAEGTMRGTNLDWFRALRRATSRPITAAGGIRSRAEIRALARIKMDAAVGMALYTGKLSEQFSRMDSHCPKSAKLTNHPQTLADEPLNIIG